MLMTSLIRFAVARPTQPGHPDRERESVVKSGGGDMKLTVHVLDATIKVPNLAGIG